MCNNMVCQVVVWFFFIIAFAKATKVEISKEWKPDFGWIITCSWRLYSNDSLQSVRLCDDDRQFMIYRPRNDGLKRSEVFHRPEDRMFVECTESTPRGLVGTCLLTIELYQPQTEDFKYSCEVSGERPKFIIDKKNLLIEAFVPPADATVELESTNADSGRVTINCTSSGVPAPHLTWTIGEQKVPHDFNGSAWNATSKLWHSWSALSYTHSSENKAVCTPEIVTARETSKGVAAMYNLASSVQGIQNVVSAVFIALILFR